MAIRVWNIQSKSFENETVAGLGAMRFLYGSVPGRWLKRLVFSKRWWSQWMGWYASRPASRKRISSFVREQGIDMTQFEATDYRSFNDFFIRAFRPGARTFTIDPQQIPAFAEARYLAYMGLQKEQRLSVKGALLDLKQLLQSEALAKVFEGGPCVVARLCPKDYHRFHYPESGTTVDVRRIHGVFDSVNPIAIAKKPDVFLNNERVVSVLQTEAMGKLAYIEVGALGVGRIVQTHSLDSPFRRGAEKGYFLFGGSTVILLGEPGRWSVDPEIVSRSKEGIETLIPLGHPIGTISRR